MAATTYTYSILNDTANAKAAGDALDEEIRQSSIVTALDGVSVAVSAADNIDVTMKDALSAGDKTILDGVIAAHAGEPLAATDHVLVDNAVAIQEGAGPTQGRFQVRGCEMDIPASVGWHEFPALSWPYPVVMFSAQGHTPAACDDDEMKFVIGPNTTVGAITADVAIGDDVINVSQTVIDNMQHGFEFHLTDGVTTEDFGVVTSYDPVALTVTVTNTATSAWAAATPTYAQITIVMGDKLYHIGGHNWAIGMSKIGGSQIPAGMQVVLRYNNRDGVAKRYAYSVEYLY
jgi:hypothetical protein